MTGLTMAIEPTFVLTLPSYRDCMRSGCENNLDTNTNNHSFTHSLQVVILTKVRVHEDRGSTLGTTSVKVYVTCHNIMLSVILSLTTDNLHCNAI